MFKGIFLIALVALFAVVSHRRGRLEEKILKRVPLSDWLIIFVFPLLFYLGWYLILRNVLVRPRLDLFPVADIDLMAIAMFFWAATFVGNSIHFTGKIMWRYLKDDKRALSYKVNEMFHGRLGHYLIYFNCLFVAFMLPMIEINHPLSRPISTYPFFGIVIAAMMIGLSSTKSIFYTSQWFGGYNKPLFFLVFTLTLLLYGFGKMYELDYGYYPLTIFVTSVFLTIILTYFLRFCIVLLSLREKRRLQFLVRFMQIG